MLFSLGKRDDSLLPLYLFHRAKIEGGKRSSNETLRPLLPPPLSLEEGGEEKREKSGASNVFLPLLTDLYRDTSPWRSCRRSQVGKTGRWIGGQVVEVFRGADSVRFDRMVGGRNRFHTVPYARVRRRRKQVLDLRRRTATHFAFPPRNTPFPRGGADASDATPPFAGRQRVVPLSFIFPPFPRFFFLFFLSSSLTLVVQPCLDIFPFDYYIRVFSSLLSKSFIGKLLSMQRQLKLVCLTEEIKSWDRIFYARSLFQFEVGNTVNIGDKELFGSFIFIPSRRYFI